MRKLLGVGLALSVAACSVPASQTGNSNNPRVEFANSVTFRVKSPITHIDIWDSPDRLAVEYRLKNFGYLYHAKVKSGTFPAGLSEVDDIRVDVDQISYRNKGISFDPSKIKLHGPFSYLSTTSQNYHCFIFDVNFNRSGDGFTERMIGSNCYAVTDKTAEVLEAEMFDIMDQVLVDGHPITKD